MATRVGQPGWVVVPQVEGLRETVYGVKTHYVHAGEGEPVILLHGAGPGASGETGWRKTIPALAERFHVYALDQIGYGYTDRPLIEYSFQTMVNHVAGFVEALGLDQVRLVGNSQGGYVAMKYALDHPSRPKQLGLIATGTLAGACGILGEHGREAPLPRFDGTRESLRAFMAVIVNDPEALSDDLLDQRMELALMPGHQEARRSLLRYRQVLASDTNQRQLYEVGARLPLFTIPWCMIWGADDKSAPLDPLGHAMHAMFPDIPFHVVQGAGHQVQTDQPDECNRLLLDFFGAPVAAPAGA
jgi:pimeloyl-ACP methyl ester carboxylesterase